MKKFLPSISKTNSKKGKKLGRIRMMERLARKMQT